MKTTILSASVLLIALTLSVVLLVGCPPQASSDDGDNNTAQGDGDSGGVEFANADPGKCTVCGNDAPEPLTATHAGKFYAVCTDECMSTFMLNPNEYVPSADTDTGDGDGDGDALVHYACSMNHEITTEAGDCPVCSMAMAEVEVEYACPMECSINEAPGPCPQCNMEMSARVAGSGDDHGDHEDHGDDDGDALVHYACPMNCEITTEPGDCPVCSMAMAEVEVEYVCPMECSINEAPGPCPQCNMEMSPRVVEDDGSGND